MVVWTDKAAHSTDVKETSCNSSHSELLIMRGEHKLKCTSYQRGAARVQLVYVNVRDLSQSQLGSCALAVRARRERWRERWR